MIIRLLRSIRIYILFGKIYLNGVDTYFLPKSITKYSPALPLAADHQVLTFSSVAFLIQNRAVRKMPYSFILRLKHPAKSRDILRIKFLLRQLHRIISQYSMGSHSPLSSKETGNKPILLSNSS